MSKDTSSLSNSFPAQIDFAYIVKITRRNFKVAFFCAVIVALFGVVATYKAKDVYRSSVTAVFDRRDALVIGPSSTAFATAIGIESTFQARFSDADFLIKIADAVGLDTEGRLKRLMVAAGLGDQESNSDKRARYVNYLKTRIMPHADPGASMLMLEVLLDDTAEKSQDLASTAMEMFISDEFAAAADRLAGKADILERALLVSRSRLRDLQRAAAGSRVEKKQTPSAAADSQSNPEQREVDLLDRLKIAEREYTSINDDFVRRRNLLEADFMRLSSRLSPNHPELLAKRRELDLALLGEDPSEPSGRNLSRLRRELLLTRTTTPGSISGIMMGDSSTSLEERVEASQLASLEQVLADVNLERENLKRQMADMSARTRIKVIRPATFDIKPAARTKMKVGLASAVLVLFAFAGAVVAQESRSTLARDAWRVERAVDSKVIAQISNTNLDRFKRITPDRADEMRASLISSAKVRVTEGAATLLAYRQVELALKRSCQGRIICLASAGVSDNTSDFVFNLANILVTDGMGRVLVIDADPTDPIVKLETSPAATLEGQTIVSRDFVDCLVEGTDLVAAIWIATDDRAFDILPVTRQLVGERSRSFQEDKLRKVAEDLAARYDVVLFRSLPERLFIENAAIAAVSSDLIMSVDARRTTLFELSRTIGQLGEEKLRGLVLIGT